MPRLTGLAPVIDQHTQVVVFGSFPGVRSLAAQQYYAHPQNQFWRLLGEVLNEPLTSMPYESRLERLRCHRVGLWDVIASCERSGSLDSAIKAAQFQDFEALKHRCPNWVLACFNGKSAGAMADEIACAGIRTKVLPSTSPAHATMTFAQKLQHWQNALGTDIKRTT